MKTSIAFIGAAFLFISINTHTMWLAKWAEENNVNVEQLFADVKSDQQVIDETKAYVNEVLEKAYKSAVQAQKNATEVKHEILTYFNSPFFQHQSKDVSQNLKSLPLQKQLSNNSTLKELPSFVKNGSDIDKPIIKIQSLPSWFFKAHLGVGLVGAVLILSGAGSAVIIVGGVNAALLKFYGVPLAVWSGMNIVAPGLGSYNTTHYATLFNKALENKDTGLVEYLLAHNMDSNQTVYDNINKTNLYVTSLTPVKKALQDRNMKMANLLLRYDAAIDNTLFTKEVIEDKEAFICLLTTYLYRQAKETDAEIVHFPKSFAAVAEDLAALIHALKPTEREVFKNALCKYSEEICSYFEEMSLYYKRIRNSFHARNPLKFEGIHEHEDMPTTMLDPHYDQEKIVNYNTGANHLDTGSREVKVDIKAPAIFIFDSKDANNILVSLFSPLNLASVAETNGNWEQFEMVIDYLLEQGAYINIYFSHASSYITPLHKAILQSSIPCIKYLLSRKASPNMLTSEGKHPLEIAVEQKNANIANLLLDNQPEQVDMLSVIKKSSGFITKLERLLGEKRAHDILSVLVPTAVTVMTKVQK